MTSRPWQQPPAAAGGYRPSFKPYFFHPKYWPYWLLFLILGMLAFVPPRWRDPLVGSCGSLMGRLSSRSRRRAQLNLQYCFPNLHEAEREQLIDNMFTTAAQVLVTIAELGVRGRRYLEKRVCLVGHEHLKQAQRCGHRVIFMVPHGWGIDFAAVSLAAIYGMPIVAMMKPHKNLFINWLWNRIRLRFGGRLHSRQQGIKPFVHAIRSGYTGYYLPDQDHGAEKSQVVDFFATYKATLPILGQLTKLCQAVVIPLFPVYNAKQGLFELHLRPAMNDLSEDAPAVVARRMNSEIECLVTPYPEQYMWILKLLKTRKPSDPILYR